MNYEQDCKLCLNREMRVVDFIDKYRNSPIDCLIIPKFGTLHESAKLAEMVYKECKVNLDIQQQDIEKIQLAEIIKYYKSSQIALLYNIDIYKKYISALTYLFKQVDDFEQISLINSIVYNWDILTLKQQKQIYIDILKTTEEEIVRMFVLLLQHNNGFIPNITLTYNNKTQTFKWDMLLAAYGYYKTLLITDHTIDAMYTLQLFSHTKKERNAMCRQEFIKMHKAHINTRRYSDQLTPLDCAVADNFRPDIIHLLLSNGADPAQVKWTDDKLQHIAKYAIRYNRFNLYDAIYTFMNTNGMSY